MSLAASSDGVLLAVTARIPMRGVGDFQRYESMVLPLLPEHGGVLERRLRTPDGTLELHVLRFESRAALDRFRADPRRLAAAPLLTSSAAVVEMCEMTDVA